MSVVSWSVISSASLALIVLSVSLLFAGLTGRQGVLRIGDKAVMEGTKERQTRPRSVRLSNVVLGCIGLSVSLAIVLIVVF
jgi:hypothetical protein